MSPWETPPPEHAEALGLAPARPTLVHRYESAAADGSGLRTAVTSFSAVAVTEVEELTAPRPCGRLRVGAAAAGVRLDAQGRADPAPARDAITRLPQSVRVTRRVHDQYDRPLEITELLVEAQQDALVYELALPRRRGDRSGDAVT